MNSLAQRDNLTIKNAYKPCNHTVCGVFLCSNKGKSYDYVNFAKFLFSEIKTVNIPSACIIWKNDRRCPPILYHSSGGARQHFLQAKV